MTEDFVKEIFGAYGGISSVKVLSTPEGADNSAALVRFRDQAQATWLVENLNGNIPKGLSTPVIVRYANPGPGKGEGKGAAGGDPRYSPYGKGGAAPVVLPVAPLPINTTGEEGSNLYIRGLPPQADDLYLYKVFAPIGAILSVKSVNSPEKGGCAGYGFVKYATLEEANKAISLLNSTPLPDGTMLQVSVKTPGGKGKALPSVVPAKNGAMPFPTGGGEVWQEPSSADMDGLVAAIAASGDADAAAALAALS
jgi:ELAV like protein 2/3/4